MGDAFCRAAGGASHARTHKNSTTCLCVAGVVERPLRLNSGGDARRRLRAQHRSLLPPIYVSACTDKGGGPGDDASRSGE